MKKMKKIVPLESESPPYADYKDQRTRHRHQSLLQDHEELLKEMEVMRRKLQIMKQRKLMLSSEVRFFRHRYRYLMKNASLKQASSQQQNLRSQAPVISKAKNYSRKESNLSAKERSSNGVEVKLKKTAHMFDLNQNARSSSGKDASFESFLSSAPQLDLKQKDRIHKEAAKKSITPCFDLNQISTEEELLGDIEPMKIEEPKRSMRGEQHGDIKLSACRNAGNKSNRTGKRKISRQDQVALRV